MKNNSKKHPTSFRELRRFLIENGGRDCFSRAQGQIWMITQEGNWKYASRCLPELKLQKYLELSLKY